MARNYFPHYNHQLFFVRYCRAQGWLWACPSSSSPSVGMETQQLPQITGKDAQTFQRKVPAEETTKFAITALVLGRLQLRENIFWNWIPEEWASLEKRAGMGLKGFNFVHQVILGFVVDDGACRVWGHMDPGTPRRCCLSWQLLCPPVPPWLPSSQIWEFRAKPIKPSDIHTFQGSHRLEITRCNELICDVCTALRARISPEPPLLLPPCSGALELGQIPLPIPPARTFLDCFGFKDAVFPDNCLIRPCNFLIRPYIICNIPLCAFPLKISVPPSPGAHLEIPSGTLGSEPIIFILFTGLCLGDFFPPPTEILHFQAVTIPWFVLTTSNRSNKSFPRAHSSPW